MPVAAALSCWRCAPFRRYRRGSKACCGRVRGEAPEHRSGDSTVMDTLSPDERSRRMSLVRSKDTGPEMRVRRLVHGLGYRYRLHQKDLPGKPDLVFPGRHAVVFVHGCFWHRHPDPTCSLARLPKSRQDFWLPKLEANRARDMAAEEHLHAAGWRVLTIWECKLRDMDAVAKRVVEFLGRRDRMGEAPGC